LEYGSESESESESDIENKIIIEPILDPKLIEPYQFLLLKPASSYEKYQYYNNELAPRFLVIAKN
jgi:hypothetical protein